MKNRTVTRVVLKLDTPDDETLAMTNRTVTRVVLKLFIADLGMGLWNV